MSDAKKKHRKKYKPPEGMTVSGILIRLDPSPRQAGLMFQHAGAARFAYNTMLTHITSQLNCIEPAPQNGKADWSMYAMRKWWNTWKNDIAPWWDACSKEAYNSGFRALADAFGNYFDRKNGDRGGERVGWPKPKRKYGSVDKWTYTTGSFGIIPDDPYGLKLPRIGRVHCMENVHERTRDCRILAMTIRHEHNQWWASLRVETIKPAPNPNLAGSVGVDLGVKKLATLSDGTVIENPKYLKQSERKLAKQQRRLSRRHPGSKRYAKKKRQVNKLHARVANQRRDLRDKTTTWLANTYADISIEDLNVKGMTARPQPKPDPEHPGQYLPNGAKAKSGLNKSILDAGFGEFRRKLEYKCALTGSRLHVIDRFYASSKTCSNCGTVKTTLPLNERVFHCDSCGTILDRDLNAAININTVGSTPARNERGETHGPSKTRRNGRKETLTVRPRQGA